jgi:serine/threonine protein kinase
MAGNADIFTLIEGRQDIDGRFVNLRRKGEGTFSLVLEATDSQSGRQVAVKVFHPNYQAHTYRRECFNREEALLQRIKGTKNVLEWIARRSDFSVMLTDINTGITFPLSFQYFVVELAASDAATELRNGTWDAERKLLAFREMCKGVQRVHREGICHRDIKPSNFLVLADGDLKLSDFGTARELNGSDPALLVKYDFPPGDSRYTAPELFALLHDADPQMALFADFYSLGATFFEMWTGAILGPQIFDNQFMTGLMQSMNAVDKNQRIRTYLGFVQNIASARPLPTITSFRGDIPPSVCNLVEDLYQSLAALDYRKRLRDFERVFLRIGQCLLVLQNEEKVRAWRQRREVYRRNREEKCLRARMRVKDKEGQL